MPFCSKNWLILAWESDELWYMAPTHSHYSRFTYSEPCRPKQHCKTNRKKKADRHRVRWLFHSISTQRTPLELENIWDYFPLCVRRCDKIYPYTPHIRIFVNSRPNLTRLRPTPPPPSLVHNSALISRFVIFREEL